MHSTLTSPFFWKEVLQLHTSHKCLKCCTFMASPPQPAMDVLTLSEKNLKQTGLPGKWSCSSAWSQHFVFVILRWAEEKSMVSKRVWITIPSNADTASGVSSSHCNAPRRLPTYGAGGRTRCVLQQEQHLTTTVLQEAGGLYLRVTRKHKLHNTVGLQIVKHYKTRNVSTTIQHVLRTKYI